MTRKNDSSLPFGGGPLFFVRALCAFLIAFLALALFQDGVNPVYAIALGALLTVLYGKLRFCREKRRLAVVSGIFSFLFSCSLFLGTKIDSTTGECFAYTKFDLLYLPALCLALFPCVFLLLEYLSGSGSLPFAASRLFDEKRPHRFALIAAGLIFLCYLFTYLCYFPAVSTYDTWVVLAQASHITPLSDWHPFLYTLLMRVFTGHSLWSLQTGIALFAFLQMLFMALCAGYTVLWMLKKRLHWAFAALTALYFALPPLFATFAISLWKDIPFAAAVLLYSLCLYDLLESKGQTLRTFKGILRYILLTFLTGILRHNGFYIVLVVSAVLLVYFIVKQKKESLRLLPVLLAAVALTPIVNQTAYALGVEKGPSSEAMSIPAQQIARIYVSGGNITPEQREQLVLYFDLDMLREYDPFLADPAKNSMDKEYFDANKGGFLKLWFSLMGSNPETYVQAYLLQTHGYWHIGDKPESIVFPTANELSEVGIEKKNLLGRGALIQFWESTTQPYDFISIGTLVWVMLLCVAVLLIRKQYTRLITLLPVLGVWGTTMIAAPTSCSYRYMYALLLAVPLILFLAAAKSGAVSDDTSSPHEPGQQAKSPQ